MGHNRNVHCLCFFCLKCQHICIQAHAFPASASLETRTVLVDWGRLALWGINCQCYVQLHLNQTTLIYFLGWTHRLSGSGMVIALSIMSWVHSLGTLLSYWTEWWFCFLFYSFLGCFCKQRKVVDNILSNGTYATSACFCWPRALALFSFSFCLLQMVRTLLVWTSGEGPWDLGYLVSPRLVSLWAEHNLWILPCHER